MYQIRYQLRVPAFCVTLKKEEGMGGRLMRRPNPRDSGAFPLGGAISVEKSAR